MRRRWAWGAAAAATAGLAVATAVSLAGAAGTRSAADPAGDAGAGFDITSVTVANDDAGRITFRIALPAVGSLPDNMGLTVVLDTDQKLSESNPIDYGIVVARNTAVLTSVTPGGAVSVFAPRSLTTSFAPGLVGVSIARSDLGNPRALIVAVASFTLAADGTPDTAANTDVAPDTGLLYALKLPTKLIVRSTSLSPGRPAAGGPFRAGAFVRDVTFGAPGELPKGGRVTCRVTVGGEKVTAARSLTRAGRATCAGTVPGDAAGQALRGTVTYTLNGVAVKRSFATTVAG
jgi:hypothetical protein